MNSEIRVRFAPSPTGALHIGGVRTALYNYLFAKKEGGKMILRIEDTDQSRFVEGAEAYIQESLQWLGIVPDESPEKGGEYGPYRQSERKDIYQQYAQQLIDEGNAYYAFDTPAELDAMRERLKAAKANSLQYNGITRMQMKNSLTLSEEEVKQKIAAGEPYVIRLKVPSKEEVRLQDLVRDWVMVHSSSIDDKILMKSDGMPTYHLANVVDDHLMKITHVIRGEEWLPSAPLHVLLYRFLGWEDTMPKFAHLPLLLKPDGNGKLSKRDGDKLGFPVFPINGQFPGSDGTTENFSGFRESGYLFDAFVNFIVLLGWNPGTEQEIFSLQELIDIFSLERIVKSGAKFDIEKAKWFNQQYLKTRGSEELADLLADDLFDQSVEFDKAKLAQICEMLKERVTFPQELYTQGKFFFSAPEQYDEKATRKKWTSDMVNLLSAFKEVLQGIADFNAAEVKGAFQNFLEEKGVNIGQVMPGLRLALTGKSGGPDLMEIMEILGKKEVVYRIDKAIDELPVKQVS